MERIIGGIKQKFPFPICKTHKLLWPCFEFIAYVDGLDNYEKNILDEVFLRLAQIGVTSDEEITECTALETDTISFMRSRLQQKTWLDEAYHITEEGEKVIEKFGEKRSIPVYVYVDAISGRIVPHVTFTSRKKEDTFDYESPYFSKDDKSGASLFSFRSLSASTGTESEESEIALMLRCDERLNIAPDSKDVTAMLHRLYPHKDGLHARVESRQNKSRKDDSANFCWILLDLLLPEGDVQNWVCTDGFGALSTFFSVEHIGSGAESVYISNLRTDLKNKTNAVGGPSAYVNSSQNFNEVVEKNSAIGSCFLELKHEPTSPDEEKEWKSSRINAILYTDQLAEWALYCMLTCADYETKARQQLEILEKRKPPLIADTAMRCAQDSGFDFCERGRLKRDYAQIRASFVNAPALVAILDLALCTFRGESWFKNFAQGHRDFISRLLLLNDERNESFHSAEVSVDLKFLERMRKDIHDLLYDGLGLKFKDDGKISFAQINAKRNARLSAISQMEKDLGFALYYALEATLKQFYIEMECRSPEMSQVENEVVLNMYQVLERVFVLSNVRLDDSLQNSSWRAKAKSAGFVIDEDDCSALVHTKPEFIAMARKREKSSMNAACIAFFTLAEHNLLRQLKALWPEMPADISYITQLRGHGEIPREIDVPRVWGIKGNIRKIIKFLAGQGYLV